MFIFLAQPQLCQLLLCVLCWPGLPPMSSHVLASLPIPNCSAVPLRALNPAPSSSPDTSGLYLPLRMLRDHFGKILQQCKMRPFLGGSSHEDAAAAPDPAIPIPGNQAAHRAQGPQTWGQSFFLSLGHSSKETAGDGQPLVCPSSTCDPLNPSWGHQGSHQQQKGGHSQHQHSAKCGFTGKPLSQMSLLLLYHPWFSVHHPEIIANA